VIGPSGEVGHAVFKNVVDAWYTRFRVPLRGKCRSGVNHVILKLNEFL
jgi:hypothetical protein